MTIARQNIRVFYWATLFGSINLLEPVTTMFYLHRGLTPVEIFFSLTAFSGSMLLAEVPTGAFADRYGPRRAFITGAAIMALAQVLLLVIHQPWAIFVSNGLRAVGFSFFSGADEALIYESLKESGEEGQMSAVMGRINSAGFLTMTVAYLVGPLLARGLTEEQFMLVIGVGALAQLVRLGLMLGIKNPAAFEHGHTNPWQHVRNAVGVIRSNPDLFLLFMNASLVFIPTYVFQRWDTPYLTGAGLPVQYMGAMYAAGAVLSWFLSRRLGAIAAPRVRVVLWSGVAIMLPLAGAALFGNALWMAGLAFFLVRAGRTIRNPILGQMQNEHIPSGSRATVLSIISLLDSVLDVVVVPLMALLAGFGLSATFAACAGVVALGLLFPVREAAARMQEAKATA